MYRSTDTGASWKLADNAFVRVLTVGGRSVFAGTFYGEVLRSDDDGVTWTEVGSAVGSQFVVALAAGDRSLFAGTLGSSVWRYR